MLFKDSSGKYILYNVPWDTRSDMIKWALDLHKADYIDRDVPFGFHIWETLSIPNQPLLHCPVLVNQKQQVFKTPTEIIMYLYSQAFSGRVRLYATQEALEEQEYYDRVLYPAARTIFLDFVLKRKTAINSVFLESHHLPKWNSIMQLTWPILFYVYRSWFWVTPRAVTEAWKDLENCIDRANMSLESKEFLAGDRITAADLSFVSHASPIFELFDANEKVQQWKETKAGLLFDRLKKERVESTGKKLDQNNEEYSPQWGDNVAYLRASLVNAIMLVVIPIVLPIMIAMDWKTTCGYWLILLASLHLQGVFEQNVPLLSRKFSQLRVALANERAAKKSSQVKAGKDIVKSAAIE